MTLEENSIANPNVKEGEGHLGQGRKVGAPSYPANSKHHVEAVPPLRARTERPWR